MQEHILDVHLHAREPSPTFLFRGREDCWEVLDFIGAKKEAEEVPGFDRSAFTGDDSTSIG